jgi:hypothetical protein
MALPSRAARVDPTGFGSSLKGALQKSLTTFEPLRLATPPRPRGPRGLRFATPQLLQNRSTRKVQTT